MVPRDTLVAILDLARWAPSGDNTQPWRFEVRADGTIAIHGFDTRDHVIYDFDGHASHIAHGALLETLRIAASGFGCAIKWQLRAESPDGAPVYDIRVMPEAGLAPDPLLPFIESRVVQRRPMQTTPLSAVQRQALVASVGGDYELIMLESLSERARVARLLWDNAYIRLTCPEAFAVHSQIIEWGVNFSQDRIPEPAVGVDPMTAKLMRWVMQSWSRVDFFNRYLMGTIAPRVQLDLLPALRCAAHVMLKARRTPQTLLDYVSAGVAMQRLWLTVAAQGLHLQPEMTPVIFGWYVRAGRSISTHPGIDQRAAQLTANLSALPGVGKADGLVFMGRVGQCATPTSRSIRRPLESLLIQP